MLFNSIQFLCFPNCCVCLFYISEEISLFMAAFRQLFILYELECKISNTFVRLDGDYLFRLCWNNMV